MTILSQAEAIRDATVPNSLTPDIVGDCLVDIANALVTNSASYITGGTNTVIPSGTAVPVFGGTTPADAIKTGSGITVEMDGGDDYAIFADLSASHAYSVVYSISVSGSEAAQIEFGLLDAALSQIAGVLGVSQEVTTGVSMCTYSATVTGETDVILGVGRLDSTDPITVSSLGVSARIVDLGLAV